MTILASVNNKTVMPGITPIADVPDRPTIGTATAAGLAASITFTASTTGGTPTTFTATSNPGSLTGTSATSPITVSGLTADTSYTFTVTAGNSTGTSSASAASNSITAVSPLSGGYDSLATVTVGATAVASVTFAGVPTGYKNLQIRGISRASSATNSETLSYIQFNGDTGSNYSYHYLEGDGTTRTSGSSVSQTQGLVGFIPMSGTLANTFNVTIIDILDYANTNKNKTVRALTGFDQNNNGEQHIELHSSLWINTNAITSITLTNATTFTQYSSFALYGVK